jgi:hypothetical protein
MLTEFLFRPKEGFGRCCASHKVMVDTAGPVPPSTDLDLAYNWRYHFKQRKQQMRRRRVHDKLMNDL